MPAYPAFVDIEASSLRDDSYPLEIAWNEPDGEIRRYLIRPHATWNDWCPKAELIHGISRERVERNGWDHHLVAEETTRSLVGRPAYSTAPDFDNAWLQRLFAATGRPCPLRLEHSDELLLSLIRRPDEMIYQAMLRIDELKHRSRRRIHGEHTAGGDVGWLIQLYHAATGQPVTMNHDIGPLPEATPTGTFQMLKTRLRPGAGLGASDRVGDQQA
jgi:hypothetical protein